MVALYSNANTVSFYGLSIKLSIKIISDICFYAWSKAKVYPVILLFRVKN